jgi:hypothetical protein
VNAARVKERVLEIIDDYPDTKALVLDLESTDQLEITSADMLTLLLERLRDRAIDLYLVRVRFRVRVVLTNTGMRAELGDDHLWHSITQGVRAARRDHGLKVSHRVVVGPDAMVAAPAPVKAPAVAGHVPPVTTGAESAQPDDEDVVSDEEVIDDLGGTEVVLGRSLDAELEQDGLDRTTVEAIVHRPLSQRRKRHKKHKKMGH